MLQGCPINTLDTDIVYDRAEDNIQNLAAALVELDKLLQTRLGILDVLATIEEDTGYAELLPHAEVIPLHDLRPMVLSLDRLIEVKRKLTRPKDQLMLLQLEATRDERRKRLPG